MSVDLKIGFSDSPRELSFSSATEREELARQISQALNEDQSVLELDDAQGRRFLVRTDRIAWVELGEGNPRQVGFIGN